MHPLPLGHHIRKAEFTSISDKLLFYSSFFSTFMLLHLLLQIPLIHLFNHIFLHNWVAVSIQGTVNSIGYNLKLGILSKEHLID